MKTDFKPFKVGTIFNPIKCEIKNNYPVLDSIKISFPSRLNAMAIDPSKIAKNNNLIYTPGEVVFSIKIYKDILVKVISSNKCEISKRSNRKSLIKHTFEIMKKAIGFKNGLYIDVSNNNEINHVGLGSSSSLIAGVASAINEIYGNPIDKNTLVKYLAQNHGEEIKGIDNYINPVQCIGGSAASGIFEGGVLILAGESQVIKTAKVGEGYEVIMGIPKDFQPIDSKEALEIELDNIDGFIKCGEKYGDKIAYNILHNFLPAMVESNLKKMGDVIYNYRFSMGSIKNCSCLYPNLINITNRLSYLKERGYVDILSISSVGPTIFAITKNPAICLKAFKKENLKIFRTKIENNAYQVLNKKTKEELFWNSSEQNKFFFKKPACSHVKKILIKIKNKKNRKLLDLGCGAGRNTEMSAQLGFDTYAIDLNEKMIETTRNRLMKFYNKKELQNRIKKGSIFNLPFGDNSLDLIISTGVFHQAKSKEMYEKAIKETSRVLKKDGILITNIFTSKLINKNINKIGDGVVITKDGLYMTLLSKEEYLALCKKYNLNLDGKVIEEIIDINKGLRSILRANLKKK